ncbi:hypothetical protein U8Q06_04065 [Rhizobium beringeri]|uniref:hypothetical protein n=1 Tax=Rhizobium beringeri TaxID=3019934 RepID=UPI002E0F1456|nr:hypothetical protein U8Q06_04065 [Rhizobium beringeri]
MFEVNFELGIILPRATPARSGVMHSMSSMPLSLSHRAASFQFATPRRDPGSGGIFFEAGTFLAGFSVVFFGDMTHRFVLIVAPS